VKKFLKMSLEIIDPSFGHPDVIGHAQSDPLIRLKIRRIPANFGKQLNAPQLIQSFDEVMTCLQDIKKNNFAFISLALGLVIQKFAIQPVFFAIL
jgi:hypothetical protein